MFVSGELRRKDLPDNPCLIDDVGDASWKQPQRLGNRKLLAEQTVRVADQGKRKSVLLRERPVAFLRIAADANHFRPGLDELLIRIAKGACLFSTHRRAILGVEEKHQRTLPPIVGKAELLAVRCRRGKVRCADANFNSCHSRSHTICDVDVLQRNATHAIHNTKTPRRLQAEVRNQLVETSR